MNTIKTITAIEKNLKGLINQFKSGALALILTTFSTSSLAAPMFYTIEGIIDNFYSQTESANDYGIELNSTTMTYLFMVDNVQQGQYIINGTTTTFSDTSTKDYYYSELLSESFFPDDSNIFNSGYSVFSNPKSSISAGNAILWNYSELQLDWTLGSSFRFTEDLNDGSNWARITGLATITEISATDPTIVPEPSTLIMLTMGLLGLSVRKLKTLLSV